MHQTVRKPVILYSYKQAKKNFINTSLLTVLRTHQSRTHHLTHLVRDWSTISPIHESNTSDPSPAPLSHLTSSPHLVGRSVKDCDCDPSRSALNPALMSSSCMRFAEIRLLSGILICWDRVVIWSTNGLMDCSMRACMHGSLCRCMYEEMYVSFFYAVCTVDCMLEKHADENGEIADGKEVNEDRHAYMHSFCNIEAKIELSMDFAGFGSGSRF